MPESIASESPDAAVVIASEITQFLEKLDTSDITGARLAVLGKIREVAPHIIPGQGDRTPRRLTPIGARPNQEDDHGYLEWEKAVNGLVDRYNSLKEQAA